MAHMVSTLSWSPLARASAGSTLKVQHGTWSCWISASRVSQARQQVTRDRELVTTGAAVLSMLVRWEMTPSLTSPAWIPSMELRSVSTPRRTEGWTLSSGNATFWTCTEPRPRLGSGEMGRGITLFVVISMVSRPRSDHFLLTQTPLTLFQGDGDDEFVVSLIGALDRDENGNVKPIQGGFNPNKVNFVTEKAGLVCPI